MGYDIKLSEKLNELEGLRTQIRQQSEDYKNGLVSQEPSLSLDTVDIIEKMTRNIRGNYDTGVCDIREAITTTDKTLLIPKIIEGKMREAAEPTYLASNLFKKIKVEGANSSVYVIPVVGDLVASEVAEGGTYNEDALEFNTLESSSLEIRVKKYGLKVSITEETIMDSQWDILGMTVDKMGKAMARIKEEQCFISFTTHGHTVFDNELRASHPEAGTTGRGEDGNFNDTLSVEDFLDLMLGLISNEYNPTDIIMHPLTWLIFARNNMVGNGVTFGALGGNNVHPWGAVQGTPGFAGLSANGSGQSFILSPEQVQGRLPMPIKINFSPYVKFDKIQKRFDMYCLDAENVGVIAEREALTMDKWTDPERDIRMLKCKERYGIGIVDNGRAVAVAKNIAASPTYPVPPTVTVKTTN